MTANDSTKLNDRLNHVENQMVSVVTKVENMQGDVTGLVTSFNEYVRISNLAEKTDWSNIAVWIGLAFICISAMLYHNRLTLTPVELTNQHQQKEIDRQERIIEANFNRPHETNHPL